MISWLWGGGGASKPPPLSPALQQAQAILGEKVFSDIRARGSLSNDQALATSCGLTTSDDVSSIPMLTRHLGAAVRAHDGEEQSDGPTTISSDAVVLAAASAVDRPSDFAFSALAAGTDDTIPLATVEAVLRDLLSLVVDDEDGDAAARALALGWAAAQAAEEAGGGMGAGVVVAASSPLTRAGFKAWAKKGSGVVVADCLAGLLRGLGEHGQEEQPRRRLFPPPPLLLPLDNDGTAPLLLTPATALALAPHVPDPRRRLCWRLIYSSARHGKSWSALCGRLRAAGAAAARAVEARADAAALAAAAAGGGGARGRAAARAVAVAPTSARDEDAGPPATLVLVRDGGGAVFGGAAFSAWQRRPSFYGDASSAAFLFALSPALRVHHASGINANAQFFSGTGPPFQSLPNGLGMGGQLGAFGLFVDSRLERGHSRPNATFACAPLCSPPGQDFDVAEVEVWALPTPEEEEVEDEEGAPRGGGRGGGGSGSKATVLDRAAETRKFMQVAGFAVDHSVGVRD